MASSNDDLQTAFGDLGGAVGDLFDAEGATQSAASYRTAAKFSGTNAALEQASGAIKLAQVTRQGYLGIGQTSSDVANAGFSMSGSGLDLLRSSRQQATLAQALTTEQTQVDVNSYKEQQSAELSQASSADTAAQGDIFGSILKGVGTVLSIAALF